jgi:hypothetical protein
MMRFYFALLVFTLFLLGSCDKVPQPLPATEHVGEIEPMDLTETRSHECFSVYL